MVPDSGDSPSGTGSQAQRLPGSVKGSVDPPRCAATYTFHISMPPATRCASFTRRLRCIVKHIFVRKLATVPSEAGSMDPRHTGASCHVLGLCCSRPGPALL